MDEKRSLPIIDFDNETDAGDPCEVGLSTLSPSAAGQRSLEHALISYAMFGAYPVPPYILARHKRHPVSSSRDAAPTCCTGAAPTCCTGIDQSGDDSGVGIFTSPIADEGGATIKVDPSVVVAQLRAKLADWSARITATIRRTWCVALREYDIARSITQLARMDDRTLRDIGIERCDIPHIVRHGRDRDA
jgi:uncharacterized protein YjiS (DUF1127 family)